jgi:Tol biopolymer transport system component/DNA-binding winged helix-turn-helix (wHTH) protein
MFKLYGGFGFTRFAGLHPGSPRRDGAPHNASVDNGDLGMLNQHRNLVIPESDFLRVGDCVVDIPRREIRAPQCDLPRRITLKTLQVLLVLVSHQDHVVSREALLEWVWPDTMPTDDVLTQAIAQLRKAFGDDRDAPKYLETIAKGGYRLIAPVQWMPAETKPARPELVVVGTPASNLPAVATLPAPEPVVMPAGEPVAPALAPHRPSTPLLAAAVVLALAVPIAIGWWWRDAAVKPAVMSPVVAAADTPAPYQRITSLPGSEMFPSLSPDGSQVVYSAYSKGGKHADLMVQTTAPVPGRRITQAPDGVQDTMPAWSPDGRQIAFARIGPKDACNILLIPASGGDPRTITQCQPGWEAGVSWHPDGRHLVTTLMGAKSGDDGAIYTIDLASGAWTRLPYEKGAGDADLSPVYSPDGRWIVFHRNVSLSDLWRVPAVGGKPERLTDLRTNIFSAAWAPDGQSIVFGRYLDASVSLSRLDLRTRQVTDFGVPNTAFPSIAAKAPSLAFILYQTRSNLFSVDLASAAGGEPVATPVFPSTGLDLLPSIAPDGQQMAFASNRSARLGVWWAQLGRPESLRLIEGMIPIPRYAAVWSPDSNRMLVIGRADTEPTSAHASVFELVPESGSVRRLPVPAGEPVYAEYVPGSSRLLVVANRGSGRLGLTLYDRASTPWKALASLDDVALTRVDPARGRILFTRPTSPGLWQADLQLRGARKIDERPAPGGGRRLIVTPDKVWLIASADSCGLLRIDVDAHGQEGTCLQAEAPGVTGVSLSPDGRQLYYSAEQDDTSDIGWMRLPLLASR